VIIPTWRRPQSLTALLESLECQTRKPDETIIVCRNDDWESINAIKKWAAKSPLAPKHKLVNVHQKGHLPPLIAALNACESDIFCQIDDDAIPRIDWLSKLEQVFQDSSIGGVSGIIIDHINSSESASSSESQKKVLVPGKLSWFGRSGPHGSLIKSERPLFDANCFLGSNMAFRTNVLVGAIDLCLNGGSATHYETDIALNVQRRGYQLGYDPEIVVDHYRASRKIHVKRGWNPDECYQYAHNLTYICLKHLKWYGKLAFLFYFFVAGQWSCQAPITYLLGILSGHPVSWKKNLLPSSRGRLAGIMSYRQRNCSKQEKSTF
jgi:GT2 family glycosyltransferase